VLHSGIPTDGAPRFQKLDGSKIKNEFENIENLLEIKGKSELRRGIRSKKGNPPLL
jgi:hypothetical protein